MFCHWLVTIKNYTFEHPVTPELYTTSTAPLTRIFASREEVEWAFDLLQDTLNRLGVTGPDDERFAITLPDNGQALNLIFGKWVVLHFTGPCYAQYRVGMALQEEHLDVLGTYNQWESFTTDDEVCIRVYVLPLETVLPFGGQLRKTFETTVDYIAKKFHNWTATHVRRFHQHIIAEAVFDPEKRAQFFGDFILSTSCIQESGAIYTASLTTYSLTQFAIDTGLDAPTLARWVRAIQRKGQAILYGPPGTGKTYLAEHLARHLVSGGGGFWEIVQFHPAYTYEDFIQGLRPQRGKDGGLEYVIVPGRFLTFCEQARHRKDTCVLIIDEINRANLARVFGELMYLLEYRDRALPLAAGGMLSIPPNVYILGTMNTADRSIALVDHALRRRFAFIALHPNYELLRHYHQKTGFNVDPLIQTLKRLNLQIDDPHYAIGITFFLDTALPQHLEDIWRMEIEPYLEEYFFDQPDKARAFAWDNIESQVKG
ncbi:MAG: AAA family ATPase [Anaerolineae bacterium]|nr:AAA family ATPase [Anaerolineae bacterium]